VVLDAVTAAEEDHDLLVQVLFQEREQQQQALVRRCDHIALLQPLTRRHGAGVVNADVQRLVLEAQASQVLNLQRPIHVRTEQTVSYKEGPVMLDNLV
jgi:hypothetical protein